LRPFFILACAWSSAAVRTARAYNAEPIRFVGLICQRLIDRFHGEDVRYLRDKALVMSAAYVWPNQLRGIPSLSLIVGTWHKHSSVATTATVVTESPIISKLPMWGILSLYSACGVNAYGVVWHQPRIGHKSHVSRTSYHCPFTWPSRGCFHPCIPTFLGTSWPYPISMSMSITSYLIPLAALSIAWPRPWFHPIIHMLSIAPSQRCRKQNREVAHIEDKLLFVYPYNRSSHQGVFYREVK
jgi:hypothetical protein